MTYRCPTCHARHEIEHFSEDEAARELLAMLRQLPPAMLGYLGLFRTGKRDLAYSKTLALAKEALALCDDPGRLEAALAATVENMRAKREDGQFKPLKNHNYLRKVLEDVRIEGPSGSRNEERGFTTSDLEPRSCPSPASKTARGIGRLMDRKG